MRLESLLYEKKNSFMKWIISWGCVSTSFSS